MTTPDADWATVAQNTHRAGRVVRTAGVYEAVWVPSLEPYTDADGQPVQVTLDAWSVFPTNPHTKTAWRLVRDEDTR